MRSASSASDFLAQPNGSYFRGRRHAVFVCSPTLMGMMSWGRPDVDDVREMLSLCEVGLAPDIPPHRFLVDVRGLEAIVPATFGPFLEYTTKNRAILARNIVRQAQLRPDGIVGAIISGFSHLAKLSYPEKVFGDVADALRWLEIDPPEGVALLAELDAIRSAGSSSDAVVRLRRELETNGTRSLAELARRLGMSTRSLQRALQDAGTSYRLEVKASQIRRAQELLRDSSRPLAWVATEVGFSSVQHFATAFRRAVGATPTAWRTGERGS